MKSKIQLYSDVNKDFKLQSYATDTTIKTKITTINPTLTWNEKLSTKIIEKDVQSVVVETPILPSSEDTRSKSILNNFIEHVDSINMMIGHLEIDEVQYIQSNEFIAVALYQTLSAVPLIIKEIMPKEHSVFDHLQ